MATSNNKKSPVDTINTESNFTFKMYLPNETRKNPIDFWVGRKPSDGWASGRFWEDHPLQFSAVSRRGRELR